MKKIKKVLFGSLNMAKCVEKDEMKKKLKQSLISEITNGLLNDLGTPMIFKDYLALRGDMHIIHSASNSFTINISETEKVFFNSVKEIERLLTEVVNEVQKDGNLNIYVIISTEKDKSIQDESYYGYFTFIRHSDEPIL